MVNSFSSKRPFETGNVIDKLFYGCLVCSKRRVGLEFGASPSHYTSTPGNSEVKACPSACSLLLPATNLPNSKIEGYKSTVEWDFALLFSYLYFLNSRKVARDMDTAHVRASGHL